MPGRARLTDHAVLLGLIACWGGSYAAIKAGLADLSAPGLVAARFVVAAACLLPFALAHGTGMRQAAPAGIATGTALGAGYLLQAVGMRETTASMGGFIAGLIPILVAAGGWILFRARPGPRGALGLLFGIAGLALLVWPTELSAAANTTRGIALQFGAAVSFATHVLLITRFGNRVPAVPFCLWQLLLVAAAASAAVAIDGRFAAGATFALSARLVWILLFLGVLCTAVGIALQSRVQPRIPPLHVALLFATQPLFAALTGWVTLGDALGARDLAGAGLIVAGVVVTSLERR